MEFVSRAGTGGIARADMQNVLLISILCLFALNLCGQVKPPTAQDQAVRMPFVNNEDFEVSEIWLLNKGYSDTDLEVAKTPYQELHLQKGFTVKERKDCSLKLQNTSGSILYEFLASDNYLGYKTTHDFFRDLYYNKRLARMELDASLFDLSYKKGKRPRLLSKDPKKAGYNKWGVQIKAKGGSPVLLMATYQHQTKKIYGSILTFVFDDEARARKFDSDFRYAIKRCNSSKPVPPTPVKLPPGVIVN